MQSMLLQAELLPILRGYLAGERPLDDFRGWEVAIDGSGELDPDEAALVERLALIADTVVSRAMTESDFAKAAREVVERLEAESQPPVTTGTTSLVVAAAVVLPSQILRGTTREFAPQSQSVGRSPVEVTL